MPFNNNHHRFLQQQQLLWSLVLVVVVVVVQPLIQPAAFVRRHSSNAAYWSRTPILSPSLTSSPSTTTTTSSNTIQRTTRSNVWLQVLPWKRGRRQSRKDDAARQQEAEEEEKAKNASEAYLFSLSGASTSLSSFTPQDAEKKASSKSTASSTTDVVAVDDDHKDATIVSLTDQEDDSDSPELRQRLQTIRSQYKEMMDRLPLDYPPNEEDEVMNVTGKIASKVLEEMMLRELRQARQEEDSESFQQYMNKNKTDERSDGNEYLGYLFEEDDEFLDLTPDEEDEALEEDSMQELERKSTTAKQLQEFLEYQRQQEETLEEDDDGLDGEELWRQLEEKTNASSRATTSDDDDDEDGEEEEEEDEFDAEIRDLFGTLQEFRNDLDDDDDDNNNNTDTTNMTRTTTTSTNATTSTKQQQQKPFKPKSYEEWRMYRNVADSLDLSVNAKRSEREQVQSELQEEILQKMQDWKDYQQKERLIRETFEVVDEKEKKRAEARKKKDVDEEEDEEEDSIKTDLQVREDWNKMGLKVLESLAKTTDSEEFLPDIQKDLEDLRAKLADENFVDAVPQQQARRRENEDDDNENDKDSYKPIDLSGVFSRSIRNKIKTTASAKQKRPIQRRERFSKSLGRSIVEESRPPPKGGGRQARKKKAAAPKRIEDLTIDDILEAQKQATAPSRPGDEEEEAEKAKVMEEEEVAPEAPDTDFFQQQQPPEVISEEDDDDDDDVGELDIINEKLGTYEEQLVRNFVRKSGAKTPQEIAKVKAGYEAVLARQRELRGIEDEEGKEDELGIDIDALFMDGDDGPLDTTALLESIKRSEEETFGGLDLEEEFGPLKTDFDDLDDDGPMQKKKKAAVETPPPPDTSPSFFSSGDEREETSSFFATDAREETPPDSPFFRDGNDGGVMQGDDTTTMPPPPPDTPFFRGDEYDFQDRIAFGDGDFMPPTTPPPPEESTTTTTVETTQEEETSDGPINLSDLFAKRREEAEGKKVSTTTPTTTTTSSEQQKPPDTPFFRGLEQESSKPAAADDTSTQKARRRRRRPAKRTPAQENQLSGMQGGFLGVEAFGSSEDEDDEEYDDEEEEEEEPVDEEDEYVKARIASGGGDMADVVLGGNFEQQQQQEERSSYYASKESMSAGYDSFRAELFRFNRIRRDQIELLMKLKDRGSRHDPYRFMPRVKQPLDQFGVILRMEGLLVDVSNLQYFAWKKISEDSGFPSPREEAIEHASVVRPDIAVRQIFRWDIGFQRSQQIADEYRKIFRQVFFAYLDKGISPTELDIGVGSAQAIGDDMVKAATKQEDSIASMLLEEEGLEVMDDRPKATTGQVRRFAAETWCEIAKTYNYEEPPTYQVRQALAFPPDVVISQVFKWTDDYKTITEMSQLLMRTMDYKLKDFSGVVDELVDTTTKSEEEEREAKFLASFGTKRRYVKMTPGIKDWIKSLVGEGMSVGLVTNMDRDIADALMDYIGLDSLITSDKRVTATDGYLREGQPYLGCCLRLERKPDHVAIIDVAPNSITEAEEIEFPAVGVSGVFPVYDLTSADWIVPDIDMLTPMNIRRLFSDRETKEPQTSTQDMKPIRPRKKVMVAFLDPEEEKKAKKEQEAKDAAKPWWIREAEERQAREAAEMEEEEYEEDDGGSSFYEDPSEDDGYVYDETVQ